MSFEDKGHRPHAIHTGEVPRNPINYGPEALNVTLTTWGPQDNIFPVMYDALVANWGEFPSHTFDSDWRYDQAHLDGRLALLEHRTGWNKLTRVQQDYVESAFAGKTLPQVLEGIKLHFTIDGCSRAFTHQNVRTRIGAAFMQHGGRDNDWRHRAWTMPETIRRACVAMEETDELHALDQDHCIIDWEPIDRHLDKTPAFDGYNYSDSTGHRNPTLRAAIEHYLQEGRELYAALVDAGIPWQDARRLLTMGTQTYIHDIYDYLSFKGMLANRLEHIMDWEHNCVAQLMVREVRMKCPPLMSKYLMSHSDASKSAKFAGLESWPPDMKYDPNFPCECGHTKANHDYDGDYRHECSVCVNEGRRCSSFKAKDPLPRTHRSEQNPFFILAPDAMAGGPIAWISTNGTYPKSMRVR